MAENNNLIIIDPNRAYNYIENGAVPPENLSINVQLKTVQHERTTIVGEGNVNTIATIDGGSVVDFMNGNKFYPNENTKSLTTYFTEIGSGFGEVKDVNDKKTIAPDLETLGITDINIDFNASGVPIVTMNLVDVRGRLFQYGNQSPYKVLFEMPYPVFELTVKGFYGQGVTYKLHLTKFNSRFNSDNASFEIRCDFIGYNYAYLSDLLIGYLKGVAYTTFGASKIEELGPDFTTFKELDTVALETRKLVNKIKGETEIQAIAAGNKHIESLETLKATVAESMIDVFPNAKAHETKLFVVFITNELTNTAIKEMANTEIISLNNEIKSVNGAFNPNNYLVSSIDFNKVFYDSMSINVDSSGVKTINTNGNELADATRENILAIIGDDLNTNNFSVIDLSKTFTEISLLVGNITNDSNNLTQKLATTLGSRLNELPIKPTIGNYFEILCDHADILMQAIDSVARKAENDPVARKKELSAILNNLEKPNDKENVKIKAFPNYTIKNNKTGGFEERWIGNVAPNMPEVIFINELFNGIFKAARDDKNVEQELDVLNVDPGKAVAQWFPVHVFDSPIFNKNNKNPYNVLKETHALYDFVRFIIIRAFTFLNSNKVGSSLTETEIKAMAYIEANNAINGIDEKLKNLAVNSSQDLAAYINSVYSDIKPEFGNENPIMLKSLDGENFYEYGKYDTGSSYFPTDNLLPVTIKNKSELSLANIIGDNVTNSDRIRLRDDDGYIFLGSARFNNQYGFDNGATYVKIINGDGEDYIAPDYGVMDKGDGIFDITNIRATNFSDSSTGLVTFFNDANGYSSASYFYSPFNEESLEYPSIFKDSKDFAKSKFDFNNNTFVPLQFRYQHGQDNGGLGSGYAYEQITLRMDNVYKKRRVIESAFNSYRSSNRYVCDLKFVDFDKNVVSLFGSKLYRHQTDDRAKALLFLSTIPFDSDGRNLNTTFEGRHVNFFKEKSGLIKASYPWILYIGGLLSRFNNEFIDFGTVDTNPFLAGDYIKPLSTQTLKAKTNIMSFGDTDQFANLKDSFIGNLPIQVQNEFILEFDRWVNDVNGFQDLKRELEVFKVTNETQINDLHNELLGAFNNGNLLPYTFSADDLALFSDNFLKNYINIGAVRSIATTEDLNLFNVELNPNGQASSKVFNFLRKYKVIANGTTEIWYNNGKPVGTNYVFTMAGVMDRYLGYFVTQFNQLKKDKKAEDRSENIEFKQELFQTLNGEDIRLKIYKDIKSIYDKWICGANIESKKLYDEFKFINRSYKDISQDFRINIPGMVSDLLANYNAPLISHLSKMLTDNNFNFLPMPNYLNLSDVKESELLFKTFPWSETNPTSRSMFICMYTGELSNSLDLGTDTNFSNDGISLVNTREADFITTSEDFNNYTSDNDRIPIMLVRYGDQNQAIFKSLNLDQSEFTVSNESLTIVDDLTKGNYIGQNLYDYYQNRSYSVEIEMMGNAMIQPFLYLYLENVPMFRGLYLIFRVNHSVSPGNMVTKLKAYRVKDTMTKMVDDETLFYTFFNDFEDIKFTEKSLGKLREASATGPVVIPNTVSLQTIKDNINKTKFSTINNKFTKYGIK